MRVLVADDEIAGGDTAPDRLVARLRQTGHEVVGVSTSQAARERLQHEQPWDIAIIDLRWQSEGDKAGAVGWELVRAARAADTRARTQIIIYSGYLDAEVEKTAVEQKVIAVPKMRPGGPAPSESEHLTSMLTTIRALGWQLEKADGGDLAGSYPKVFISHRHADRAVAKGLVGLLEAAFEISSGDLRCTSVQPYELPIGVQTSERLRVEIDRAEVVLGVVSPRTAESDYVLFELGASWGHRKPTFPLMTSGATPEMVPAILRERHCVSLADPGACHQLIDELRQTTSLSPRSAAASRIHQQVTALVQAAEQPGGS